VETRANYILIGAVAIVGMLATMLFALWIAGADFNRSFSTYVVSFKGPVRGLQEGGEVRFQGIKVGEVVDLRIDPKDSSRVLARVRIDANTKVRQGSRGQLEPIGLTGLNLIQIQGGEGTPELVPQMGQPPPVIQGEASEIDKLLGASGDISERASRALVRMEALLSDQNIANVVSIVSNIEAVTAELEAQKSVIGNTNRAAANFAKVAANLDGLTTDVRGRFQTIAPKAEQTVDQLNVTLASVNEAAKAGTGALSQTQEAAAIAAEQSLPDITLAAQDLRRIAGTLDSLAISVDRNPNQFVVGERKPTVKVNP
jgi:phospholipid/cholesterol/gamma-HCH transport system substrate-binding protein